MTDELRDLGGRARRLLVALVVGYAASNITVRLAATLRLGLDNTGAREWGLLWFGISAGTLCFVITLVLLNRRAHTKWRKSLLPRARLLT
ncbi:MAG: hypothetical protein H0T42_31900 [Deltaproteobacteria bacterium]|nr:hypothetical protein [Deltaproteobacteria bacterium]